MERIQKVMAEAGVASRRTCEEMIAEGRVTVNGKLVTELPFMVDKFKDRIIVDERKLRFEKKVYYLLNKPKKVICTNHDPDNRRRTIDLMKDVRERVYPVGRLDADSQGLVIMTNDGELANELTHPRYGVPKTYIAEIATNISHDDVERLKRGFFISRGGRASMDSVKVLKRDRRHSLLEITLREGRNRQIRRMLLRLGHEVTRLTRVTFGPLNLRGCGVGKHRQLKPFEIEELKKSVEKYKAKAKADSKKKVKLPPLKPKTEPVKTEEKKKVTKTAKVVKPEPVKTTRKSMYGSKTTTTTEPARPAARKTGKTTRSASAKPAVKRVAKKTIMGKPDPAKNSRRKPTGKRGRN